MSDFDVHSTFKFVNHCSVIDLVKQVLSGSQIGMEEYEVLKDLAVPLGRAPHISAQSGAWQQIVHFFFYLGKIYLSSIGVLVYKHKKYAMTIMLGL